MVSEVVEQFQPILTETSTLIDATVGSGGHARVLLEKGVGKLIGIDKDPDAIKRSAQVLQTWKNRVTLIREDFRNILKVAMSEAPFGVHGVFIDLGVSMDLIKDASRGFSFEIEGPLDMRYNPWDSLKASKIVNKASYDELIKIFQNYGEIQHPEKIVHAILDARRKGVIETTTQLAEIISGVLPRKGKLHPATRVFMALRIAVNRELEHLDRFLVDAFHILSLHGRMVIIAYHSLEDRIVKKVLRRLAATCRCDPNVGICVCEAQPLALMLTPRAIRPKRAEIRENPAARSARLRAVEKIHPLKFKDLVLKKSNAKPQWPFPPIGGKS